MTSTYHFLAVTPPSSAPGIVVGIIGLVLIAIGVFKSYLSRAYGSDVAKRLPVGPPFVSIALGLVVGVYGLYTAMSEHTPSVAQARPDPVKMRFLTTETWMYGADTADKIMRACRGSEPYDEVHTGNGEIRPVFMPRYMDGMADPSDPTNKRSFANWILCQRNYIASAHLHGKTLSDAPLPLLLTLITADHNVKYAQMRDYSADAPGASSKHAPYPDVLVLLTTDKVVDKAVDPIIKSQDIRQVTSSNPWQTMAYPVRSNPQYYPFYITYETVADLAYACAQHLAHLAPPKDPVAIRLANAGWDPAVYYYRQSLFLTHDKRVQQFSACISNAFKNVPGETERTDW